MLEEEVFDSEIIEEIPSMSEEIVPVIEDQEIEQISEIDLGNGDLLEEDDEELSELFDEEDYLLREEDNIQVEGSPEEQESPEVNEEKEFGDIRSSEQSEVDYSQVLSEIQGLLEDNGTLILDLNNNITIIGKNHIITEGMKIGILVMFFVAFIVYMLLGRIS